MRSVERHIVVRDKHVLHNILAVKGARRVMQRGGDIDPNARVYDRVAFDQTIQSVAGDDQTRVAARRNATCFELLFKCVS